MALNIQILQANIFTQWNQCLAAGQNSIRNQNLENNLQFLSKVQYFLSPIFGDFHTRHEIMVDYAMWISWTIDFIFMPIMEISQQGTGEVQNIKMMCNNVKW